MNESNILNDIILLDFVYRHRRKTKVLFGCLLINIDITIDQKMKKILDTSIELARYFDSDGILKKVTIEDYYHFVSTKNKTLIADFIFHRLHSRYLKPFLFEDQTFIKKFKNGFSIMANCCLLIETLQSFKNGWENSKYRSKEAFLQFFSDNNRFELLRSNSSDFYNNIRCGILHQGETVGGWRIHRNGILLYDNTTHVVNSIVFATYLEESLEDYRRKLISEEWDSEIWDNCRRKMRRIIDNCE